MREILVTEVSIRTARIDAMSIRTACARLSQVCGCDSASSI